MSSLGLSEAILVRGSLGEVTSPKTNQALTLPTPYSSLLKFPPRNFRLDSQGGKALFEINGHGQFQSFSNAGEEVPVRDEGGIRPGSHLKPG